LDWLALIVAGIFEAFGVMMINEYLKKQRWQALILFVLGFGTSLVLLEYSMQTISMGTAYAIWTGIGASAGTIIGMAFYGEPKNWFRIGCIALIILSTIGLKLVS